MRLAEDSILILEDVGEPYYRLERSLSEELLTSPHGSKPAGAWEDIDVAPAAAGQSVLAQGGNANLRSGGSSLSLGTVPDRADLSGLPMPESSYDRDDFTS